VNDFRKALVVTALTISLAGISSSVLVNALVWLVASGLFIAALIIVIILKIIGSSTMEWRAGILAGAGIGFVVLGITCFVNLNRF